MNISNSKVIDLVGKVTW